MHTVEQLQKLIEQRLASIELPATPADLYNPISYTLAMGGKRMRPVLLLMAAELFGEPVETALCAATGIEVFHNFTLLHDDIMDNAPLRRAMPTVHTKWNANVAILSGDTMFVKSAQLMMQVRDHVLRPVLEAFNQAAIEVCEGQQLDMSFENRDDVTIAEYEHMITLKTAVLLGAALKIGAIIAGAAEAQAQELYDFGKCIGIAFQLQDDILDVYGNAATFGKQVGGDIVANKKTFLLIKALERLDNANLKELQWLISPDASALPVFEKINAVTAIYNTQGIKELARQEMDAYYEKAMQHLAAIDLPEERKIPLRQLAESLMIREV
jgi:geranylgeranyl diphosphate synthase type II